MPQRASRPRGFAPTFGETEGNGLPEPGDFGDFPLELIDVPLEDDFVDTYKACMYFWLWKWSKQETDT